jgi:3-oxoacyl-[acyl-carrier-protein] synthase-3
MTETRFESIGAYLPETRVSTRDLMSKMSFEPPFDLQQITGIEHRRVHDKRAESFEDSFALAHKAAKDCLSRSKYGAEQLDVIISASITRYKGGGYDNYFEPSFALYLRKALGAKNATYFDVSNACAGMMSGVYMLDRMI